MRHPVVVTLEEPIAALVAAARRVLDAAAALEPPAPPIEAGGVRLDPRAATLTWPGGVAVLPPAQAAIAAALMRSPGELVPRADLLHAMGFWAAPHLTRRLDCAIARLRRRLPGRIVSAPGHGYRWLPPGTP